VTSNSGYGAGDARERFQDGALPVALTRTAPICLTHPPPAATSAMARGRAALAAASSQRRKGGRPWCDAQAPSDGHPAPRRTPALLALPIVKA
jgi:hypothetical protein